MNAHWLLAAGFAGMAVAIFFLGWSARIMRVEWRDDKALRAAEARYERHTHRKGDTLPVAGRLRTCCDTPPGGSHQGTCPNSGMATGEFLPDVNEPPWLFAGESEQGWAAESAEYELLTQTAEQPAFRPGSEIDTGELMAITDRVEGWIAQWTAQGNVDRHTIQAGE